MNAYVEQMVIVRNVMSKICNIPDQASFQSGIQRLRTGSVVKTVHANNTCVLLMFSVSHESERFVRTHSKVHLGHMYHSEHS